MAELKIHCSRIEKNIQKLTEYLLKHGIKWSLVSKVLNGNKAVLEQLLYSDVIKTVHSIGDSRISNLKTIKKIKPDIRTMYIKPPAPVQVKNVISCADISLNSSYDTIEALNEEAEKQDKIHSIIIMVELGELREGINRDMLLQFYEKVFSLQNIEIIGLGTNLGCMYGVEPTYDKLIQLNLYKQLIETKFGMELELLSSGSSITLPLVSDKRIPKGVNHFRVGESAFLGVSPLNNKKFRNLSTDAFDFSAEIVEIEKKLTKPDGVIGDAAIGHTVDIDEDTPETYRAILDFGSIDVDINNLEAKDKNIQFVGTTSDMTVYDLGVKNSKYHVGDQIHFSPNYMAVARIMNSKYITKKLV